MKSSEHGSAQVISYADFWGLIENQTPAEIFGIVNIDLFANKEESLQVVVKKHRLLCLKYHPDKIKINGGTLQDEAIANLIITRIHEARDALITLLEYENKSILLGVILKRGNRLRLIEFKEEREYIVQLWTNGNLEYIDISEEQLHELLALEIIEVEGGLDDPDYPQTITTYKIVRDFP
jgi:hypothetical protein